MTIIIAYHYSNLQADLNTFCKKFNLPQTTLNIISLGTTTDSGWALEECLDVQMVHVANPNAQITVIEAKSNSSVDMNEAISRANNLSTTQIISMSWGSNEYNGQNNNDTYFNNKKICYCASSGDNNYVNYPASSANVLSIGGSTLTLNANNTRASEKTWSSAGCGVSTYTPMPNYQSGCKNITGSKRIIPDISCIANPSYGVQMYYNGKYYIMGGTSVSAPLFAGVLSIANQKRLDNGKSTLTSVASSSANLVQQYIYKKIYNSTSLYSQNFYDITVGNDGNYNASANYDRATGLGAPLCTSLVNELVNA